MNRNICEGLEMALAADEELSAEMKAHLQVCEECRALVRTHEELGRLGEALRQADEPDDRVGARLLQGIEDRKRAGAPALGVLAWGGLAAGMLLLMLMGVFMAPSTTDEAAPGAERLLALMDDVDSITGGEQTEAVVEGWDQMFASQSETERHSNSLQQVLEDEDVDLDDSLPTGFQALNDVLEERWL